MWKISMRSRWLGKSKKKISSKRPLRSNSGGRAEISLAVAIKKTGAVFSCIQVKKLDKTRAVVPPSEKLELWTPLMPLSSSSSQSKQGAIDSAVLITVRILASDEPTKPEKTL